MMAMRPQRMPLRARPGWARRGPPVASGPSASGSGPNGEEYSESGGDSSDIASPIISNGTQATRLGASAYGSVAMHAL